MKDFEKFRLEKIRLVKKQIKQNVDDSNLIMQTVNSIEELERTGNMLTTRLREWYALYNPEFEDSMENQEKFSYVIMKKSRKILLKEIKVTMSMGADLPKKDIDEIMFFAKTIQSLYFTKNKLSEYLKSIMKKHCPNLLTVAGTFVGAKLLAKAGSLERLSKMPASTIQVLGAEKALFRHMKTGARPPRHGYLVQHALVSQAKQKEHGKRARSLADKISIAVKVDYFKGEFIGNKLKKELEKKFGVEY